MSDVISRLNAALDGRYRVERELGEGGMATVYLADDLKHERKVALKVLLPELAASMGSDRFLREITTTANLRHPNILPLFDSGEAEGLLYYVMPYVEGESLRDRLDREAPLGVDEALGIAAEIAEALEYAHGKGVVHRDIKPANVMLENGRAVVADFGVASALSDAGAANLTRTGAMMGTPLYMSPEQASGETADARSDVYSLGCVLYEMLAGQPPFTARTAVAIMARHMTDPVPDITTVRPTVPAGLTEFLERSLAKVPADRVPSMVEWREALSALAAGSGTAAPSGATAPERILKHPPAPPTELIGREAQLEDALDRLRSGARVVTLTGVGGTGKTRFAIELFNRYESACFGGAAFVSLASVTAEDEVLPTISAGLEIAEAHGRSALDALVTVLGDRHVLLVIDNFEQVIEAAGQVAELVARCPAIQVLVTSRRPLKIGAEVEFALPPLGLPSAEPAELDELLDCPSVALFVDRAEKVNAGFVLTLDNAEAVSAICRSLDGLPLALELAAARVRVLEPAALLQRLDHALDLLTSGDRDLPMRQRTLRATISWSYSLLTPEEQRLLRRLSVFHEGWTIEALEQACYDADDRWRAVDELDVLVENGLVRVVAAGRRFALLETIRAFAAEQLHAGAEVEFSRDAHAAYYLEFARLVDEGIQGGTQLEAMARARADDANTWWLAWYWHIVGLHLVAEDSVLTLQALAEAAGGGPTRGRVLSLFASAMVRSNTGDMQGAYEDAGKMARDGEAIGDDGLHALACVGMGWAALAMGRPQDAAQPVDDGLRLAEQIGNSYLIGLSKSLKGMVLFLQGDSESGLSFIHEAHELQSANGDYEGGGLALSLLASITFAGGDLKGALEWYRQAEATFATVGDKPEVARVQCEMGYAELAGGSAAAARWTFQRAVRTYDEVGSPRGTGQALMGLAAAEAAGGDVERAVAVAAVAEVMSQRAGVVVEHPLAPGVAEQIEALKATIPRERLEELAGTASTMTPAQVLAMLAA
jgi:non-specific serine/threonine protein kinase